MQTVFLETTNIQSSISVHKYIPPKNSVPFDWQSEALVCRSPSTVPGGQPFWSGSSNWHDLQVLNGVGLMKQSTLEICSP